MGSRITTTTLQSDQRFACKIEGGMLTQHSNLFHVLKIVCEQRRERDLLDRCDDDDDDGGDDDDDDDDDDDVVVVFASFF